MNRHSFLVYRKTRVCDNCGMAKVGRPTNYNQDIADEICEKLIEGKSLRAISKEDGMPPVSVICRWLVLHKEFAEQYARVKEEQAEIFADEIASIADEKPAEIIDEKGVSRYDSAAVQWQRLRVDSRKWVASKLKAKKYGDKIEHSGQVSFTPAQFELPKPKTEENT